MNDSQKVTRRPLKSRDTKWAAAIAGWLARASVRPNQISVASMLFAALAGLCFWLGGRVALDWRWSGLLVLAACGIQLRLLCNLLDGMVAVEGGLKTTAGELYNELPDRVSDALIFIGAAYAVPQFPWAREIGWTAAILAIITAYVRSVGASMGAGQHFIGPMAKPHRMALLTAACLIGCAASLWHGAAKIIPVALILISAGCVITNFRRCIRIVRQMESKC